MHDAVRLWRGESGERRGRTASVFVSGMAPKNIPPSSLQWGTHATPPQCAHISNETLYEKSHTGQVGAQEPRPARAVAAARAGQWKAKSEDCSMAAHHQGLTGRRLRTVDGRTSPPYSAAILVTLIPIPL